VRSGKLKYLFRNWPIESIHKNAFVAAEAAECAGDQGKFWEMHDRLFADQTKIAPPDLTSHARALQLDVPAFMRCLDGGKYANKIRKDLADGKNAGVTGTPAFFIGRTVQGSTSIKTLQVLKGAKAYSEFKEAIDKLLADKVAQK